MNYHNLKDSPEKEILKGYLAKYVHTSNMTIQYCNIASGSPMPEHYHPHEQICMVIKGKFEMNLDGEKILLGEGSVLVIPPNMKHSGMPLTDCYIIDVFHPRRDDFAAAGNK
ncbi:MAG TPA: cupin domain-containing protein [Desulfomonilia bacterium]